MLGLRLPDAASNTVKATCVELALSYVACAALEDASGSTASEPILAIIDEPEADETLDEGAVARAAGYYRIAIVREATPQRLLELSGAGYAFTLIHPPAVNRLRGILGYLLKAAPPTSAQTLHLDEESLTLRAPTGSTRIEPGEAVLLKALGESEGRAVPRSALPADIADVALGLVRTLRRDRFPAIGSSTRIITVPGFGWRLVGELVVE